MSLPIDKATASLLSKRETVIYDHGRLAGMRVAATLIRALNKERPIRSPTAFRAALEGIAAFLDAPEQHIEAHIAKAKADT